MITALAFLGLAVGPLTSACAQDDDAKAEQMRVAKLLENPVGNLISLPFQYNADFRIGPPKSTRQTLNIQPVIPFSLNTGWNLITRTIVPLIFAESPLAGGQTKRGLGNITQSFFFSPKEPVGGYIVGVGPVLRYPSASDSALGGGKWGAGPTRPRLSAGRRLDLWHSHQSSLVLCRQSRPEQAQCHVHPADDRVGKRILYEPGQVRAA